MGSVLETANVLVTGGAGTLGRAIAARRKKDGWTGRLTVYSTDNHKHDFMRRLFPDVGFVQGDIRNPDTLYNAMIGHDVVIHAAAVKVIPDSEYWSLDTIDVNVNGSTNVGLCAHRAGVRHVLGISTDKACHPANAYGATKMLMEKVFQEFARNDPLDYPSFPQFHLVRYGNVLESTGSVIEAWKKSIASGSPINITDPEMTRFWLSPSQAVQYVVDALELAAGRIYVPNMPALPIGKLADYVLGEGWKANRIPLRPGEKMHETLVTQEEMSRTYILEDAYVVLPSTDISPEINHGVAAPFSSDTARELSKSELTDLLNG